MRRLAGTSLWLTRPRQPPRSRENNFRTCSLHYDGYPSCGALFRLTVERGLCLLEKKCSTCDQTKPVSEFHRDGQRYVPQCKPCRRMLRKQWRATSSAYRDRQAAHRRSWGLKAYGLTIDTYEELLAAQGGVCAMCGQACSTGRRLAVDHDHETGQVRGLLCYRCNRGLGVYETIKDSAERYLAGRPAVNASVVRELPWSK